jgi:hypothetical protein
MTRADRVLSTPPLNTSSIQSTNPPPEAPAESVDSFSHQPGIGQPESENLTSESARPADRLSRRNAIAILAVGSAALPVIGIPMAAAAAIDPVFDLIEIHRKTHIAHMSSLELQARFERRYGIGAGSWISTQPCHDEDDAFTAFVAEPATTVQGLLAKLAYFAELASEFETEWMIRERAEAAVLIQSFATSLKNIGVLS